MKFKTNVKTRHHLRWIRQDKLSGSNTAPLRAFHRRPSMDRPLVDKSETWPLPDGENPVEQLKKNNKVASLMDNFKVTQVIFKSIGFLN